MNIQLFYPEWSFIHAVQTPDAIHLYIEPVSSTSRCPSCRWLSRRIHSHYWRTLRDTPIRSIPIVLYVRARKFFCDQPDCSQKIFTERQPDWWASYSRRTGRLDAFLKQLAFSISAESASRLSRHYGVPTSSDTFLSLVRKEELLPVESPTVVGIDDWSLKKGRRYGSLICDLTNRKPVDLLESRAAEDVKSWLAQHPSIQAVCRDGSMEYAKAITEGAGQTLQITDRWHLFYNLSRKADHILKRTFSKIIIIPIPLAKKSVLPCITEREWTESEQKKWQLVQLIQVQCQKGVNISTLSRSFSLDRKTVQKYIELKEPLRRERRSHHSADPYQSVILELLEQQLTAPAIFTIIQKEGYRKSLSTLRDDILALKKKGRASPKSKMVKLPRSRLHAYLWSKLTSSYEEEKAIQMLIERHPELIKTRSLLSFFHTLMTERKSLSVLEEWMELAAQSGIDAFQQFSQYLRSDWEAVKNAFLYSWSNGVVEGHVNRIKVIKRQMYGRANFDLLRQKVLFQAT